jgi:hypothetical protein
MAASDNIQWKQHLSSYRDPDSDEQIFKGSEVQGRLFERAGVLAKSRSSEQYGSSRLKEDFIANKLEQSKQELPTGKGTSAGPGENTLYESIKQHGVKHPVRVSQGKDDSYTVHHGHHRIYSANEIDPQMWIPLTDDSKQSMGMKGWQDPTTPEDKRWPSDAYERW